MLLLLEYTHPDLNLGIDFVNWVEETLNPDLFNDIKVFLDNYPQSEDALNYIEFISELVLEDNDIKVVRASEYYDLILENPNVITESCSDLDDWSDLASFVPPSTVLDKIESLGEGWRLQGFEMPTAAPRINLDYFSVSISQMPINPETNQQWGHEEFFQYFRTNINDFIDKEASEFNTSEEDIWLSDNPVPAVLSIDIQGPDNGSVVCAQSESCCWIFSTVKAPLLPGYDGYHPVSGNRQFGYFIDVFGNMEIYTKGADRFFSPTTSPFVNTGGTLQLFAYLAENVAFAGADNLWKSFQEEMNEFINSPENGGQSEIIEHTVKRPKVGNALKELLKQEEVIDFIPCGN